MDQLNIYMGHWLKDISKSRRLEGNIRRLIDTGVI